MRIPSTPLFLSSSIGICQVKPLNWSNFTLLSLHVCEWTEVSGIKCTTILTAPIFNLWSQVSRDPQLLIPQQNTLHFVSSNIQYTLPSLSSHGLASNPLRRCKQYKENTIFSSFNLSIYIHLYPINFIH